MWPNKKIKFRRHTLFIVLLVFLLLNSIYLHNINSKVSANSQIEKKIISLITINKDLNLYFGEQTNFINYDEINNYTKKFKSILKYLDTNENINSFFQKENKELYKRIENNFEIKERIISNYVTENAILSSSIRYFAKQFSSVLSDNINNETQKKRIIDIYTTILEYELSVGREYPNLEEEVQLYYEISPSNELQDFYKHALVIVKALREIYNLAKQNKHLQIDGDVSQLRYNFDIYSNKLVNQLYANMAIFMIIMVIFVFTISFLISKIQKRTNKLSQFQHAIQNTDNSIVITDIEHKIQYVNRAFEKTSGYTSELALGQTPAILQSGLHDRSFYDDLMKKIAQGESWRGEFTNRRKDGKIFYEKASIYPLVDEEGTLEGHLAIKLDITNEKKYLQEIETKNMEILTRYQIDDISGLWSKNVLNDELNAKTNGYLIYLKINNYSDIRFFYGTVTSSKIIRKIADNLKRFIALYKIDGQPFSVGEDDFCIWYKHKKPSEDLLEAIYYYFKTNPVEIDNTLHTIELYIGVSSAKDLPQGDRLLQGNIAYYKAVRNSIHYVYYEINNELEREYRHNIVISRRIRHALSEELVTVQCQPIFNTKTKEIYSYEVLMRMYDENGRMMYPGEFLDVAKQSALYTPLMHNVIAITFELSEKYPKTKFSINISTIDMLDQDTTTLFLGLLKSSSHPENIIVEILESEGIENYDAIYPFLDEVKANGCSLSIDDFGSGYSNYYRIMQLNVDYIKIDGSIIKELPYDESSRVVVETIISFAKRQGYEVVAEYVSSREIYELIKSYGIKYTQGYYLGEPILPAGLEDLEERAL